MSKIGIIIKSEYLRRVAKKSFIVLTFLVPFLLAATLFIPLWLSTFDDDQTKAVAVVDQTGKYAHAFDGDTDFQFQFVQPADTFATTKSTYTAYDAVVLIDNDLLEKPSVTIFSEKQVPSDLKRYVETCLETFTENEKLASYNIPNINEIIAESKTDILVNTIKLNEDGSESVSSTEVASAIGMLFMMLIYFFVFTYGSMVMNSVLQEKTNRIVEVLVCSVRPFELMMGKIISIALVGLTQFVLWIVFVVVLCSIGMNFVELPAPTDVNAVAQTSVSAEIIQGLMGINFVEIVGLFVVYFIGGYLIYASIFAAIGAAVDNETDTQQFVIPITIPILFAMYAAIYSLENPDGPLAFWCSMIPFTSPIVMMVRLPFEVALWEKIVSIAVLFLTFLGSTWLAAKIYRTGILMYGKKVTWRELWKWLKYRN